MRSGALGASRTRLTHVDPQDVVSAGHSVLLCNAIAVLIPLMSAWFPVARSSMRITLLLACVTALAVPLHAQTIDDGVLVPRHELLAGNVFGRDSWNEYWEGALKRVNGNIGTVTTRTNAWVANYGVTDRLNVIASVPYVWTEPNQGVLHGIQGFQDVTLAAKFQFLEHAGGPGTLRAFAVMSAGMPMTNYNPEFPPLSIGTGSTQLSWRGTANFHARPGWFLNGSFAYNWRSDVQLDRPYFFTDGEFVMSDQVDMPNAVDFAGTAGFMDERLMIGGFLSQLRTLGGGDIRRQDMPFISNRMNATRMGVMTMVAMPGASSLKVQLSVAHTLDGRNVGQATSFTAGLLYRFNRSTR